MQRQLRLFAAQLLLKGWRHWFEVVALLAVGVLAGDWLGELDLWVGIRYRIYQALQAAGPHHVYPKRTTLVLIGDREYWSSELSRRNPIKRDYLARLATKLDQADVAVLAIDFDLRSTFPEKHACEYPDYRAETEVFLAALLQIAARRAVVLPRTVSFDSKGNYILDRAIFDCGLLERNLFKTGYISLPYDLRQVPLALTLADGLELDSFSSAIARAVDSRSIQGIGDQDALPYGTFIHEADFPFVTAENVLQSDLKALRSQLAHRVVIVGGAWHFPTPGHGSRIDSYRTPVGSIPGAYIHANYVEALLDSRTYKAWSETAAKSLEFTLSLLVAIIFALNIRPILKFIMVAVFCLVTVIFTYVSWQNLGLFFDLFVPVLLLTLHAIYEQINSWRESSRHLQEGTT